MAKKRKEEKAPEGGWLGPPSTVGLPPLGEMKRGGKFRMFTLTRRERELHEEFQRRMKKADAKGIWRFRWPPKD